MAQLKHTPGPWKFERQYVYAERARLTGRELPEHEGYSRENNGDWIVTNADGRIGTATFKGTAKRGSAWQSPDPEGQANARLMAAAPELAEALQDVLKHGGSDPSGKEWIPLEYLRKAEAAIKKAGLL